MRLFVLILIALFLALAGCGGGGATTPALLSHIEGIFPERAFGVDTPGYARDELTIEVLVSGEEPTSIVWDFGGGAIPFSNTQPASPRIELGLPGEYTLRVTITDGQGLTDSASLDYIVLPESDKVRSISPSTPAGVVMEPVRFVADIDGGAEFIQWTFESGTDEAVSTDLSPVVRLTEPGTHTATLRVTLWQGPTVTRSFPFTVLPYPWTRIATQDDHRLLDSLVTSAGDIAIVELDLPSGPVLRMLRVPAAEMETPASWHLHYLESTYYASDIADLEEHDGRLGVLYQPGFPARQANLAVANSLQPTKESDWTISQVGSVPPSLATAAIVGGDGAGWNVLLGGSQGTATWAETSVPEPTSTDWTSGSHPTSASALTSIATVSLVRLPGALISGVGINSGTTIHVGQPGTFAALLTGPHYDLPGVDGRLLSHGDHLVAVTRQGGGPLGTPVVTGISLSNVAVPLGREDWTELSSALAFDQQGRTRVQLTDDELLVLAPQPIERAGMETISSMKLLRRPLDDLSVDWSREFVTEEPWIDPWAFPIPDGMILAWRPSTASSELRWHKHVGD